jgi:putative heme degradation protein
MKILLKDGTYYEVDDEFYNILSISYPRINIDEQLKKYAVWAYANAAKRKTKRGIKKSINYWMSQTEPAEPSYIEKHTDKSWAEGI